jgi:hypothetical protein
MYGDWKKMVKQGFRLQGISNRGFTVEKLKKINSLTKIQKMANQYTGGKCVYEQIRMF